MVRRAMVAWRALPTVARDGIVAGLLTVFFLVDALRDADGPGAVAVVLVVLGTAALAWRRVAPLLVVCLTGVAVCVGTAIEGVPAGPLAAALIAVYTSIAWGGRVVGTVAAVVEMAVVGLVVGIHSGDWTDEDVIVVSAMVAVAVAAGFAVGSRRTTLADVRDRAERAERSREVEAARRVAEERLRIARELHDVLGHHVAVIGVQSGVAEMLLRTDVDGAEAALGHVQDATASVLAELGALVEVLREPDEEAPASPAPGLASLDGLLTDARATGLDLQAAVSGDEGRLAPVVDLVAFRVVQEALTNAHKHGGGAVRLVLGWSAEALTIDVTNPVLTAGPVEARPGGGHGLVGMRERVQSVGGAFVAGAAGETYRVTVILPTLSLPAATEAGR